jgi:HEAT repeat protein
MRRSASAARRAGGAPALAELDSPESVESLTRALNHPDLNVRASAGVALASLRDPASLAPLAAIVASWDDPVLARARRAALRTLIAFRTQEAAVELAQALAKFHATPLDLQERAALLAVAYAEQAGTAAPRVVRALVALLAHEEQAVAERAALLVTLFPSESHRPLTRALRTSTGADVRRRAAQALGACRQDSAVAALVTALEDPAPDVRATAAHSLGNMRDPTTAAALHAASGDRNESVREAARSALDKLGTVATAASMAAGFGVLAQRSPV